MNRSLLLTKHRGNVLTAKDENAKLKKRCMRLLEQVQRFHLKSITSPPTKNSEQAVNPPINSGDADRSELYDKTIRSLKFEVSKQRKELKELREQKSAATAGEAEKRVEKVERYLYIYIYIF